MSISEFIADDLRERISSGVDVPLDLTLAGLAERYESSVMPVRIAVETLVRENVLLKQSNGRLTVNESKTRPQRANGKRNSVAPPVDWYDQISKDIVRESLQQTEATVTIDGTANKYEIGRSVAQKILIRLAGEGLIEHAPRKSWKIRPFREEDLQGYLDIRSLLELRGFDLARERLDNEDLESMLQLNSSASTAAPTKIDHSLHKYWIDRSQNRYIQDFYYRHSPYYLLLYRYAVDHDSTLIPVLAAQHCDILFAILKRRWRQARQALARDIDSLRPILLQEIGRLADGS